MDTVKIHFNLKWLLKNGISVDLKNLYIFQQYASAQIFSNTLFFTSLDIYTKNENSEDILLLTSSFNSSGLCPSWAINSLKSTPFLSKYLLIQKFYVRISTTVSNGSKSIVFDELVDLSKLVSLHSMISSKHLLNRNQHSSDNEYDHFPLNFFLLDIGDTLYTTESVYKSKILKNSDEIIDPNYFIRLSFDSEEFEHKYSLPLFENLDNLLEKKKLAYNENKTKYELQDKEITKNSKLKLIEKLKEELQKNKLELEQELHDEKDRQSTMTKSFQLEEKSNEFKLLNGKLNSIQLQIKEKSDQLLKTKFLLESRQLKLFNELKEMFPIEKPDSGEYTIRGVELPNDLNLIKDDEQVATALGYVAHLILLISKYLDIPLRYQLLYVGSRSLIKDPLNPSSSSTYPLFRRSIEKDRFDKAIQWLKGDIEQLMCTRGVIYDPNKPILFNLSLLFQCQICGQLAF